jgi:hypothetical protein
MSKHLKASAGTDRGHLYRSSKIYLKIMYVFDFGIGRYKAIVDHCEQQSEKGIKIRQIMFLLDLN